MLDVGYARQTKNALAHQQGDFEYDTVTAQDWLVQKVCVLAAHILDGKFAVALYLFRVAILAVAVRGNHADCKEDDEDADCRRVRCRRAGKRAAKPPCRPSAQEGLRNVGEAAARGFTGMAHLQHHAPN